MTEPKDISRQFIYFLGELRQYQAAGVKHGVAVERISDGTLVCLPEDIGSRYQGLLSIKWQADKNRSTEVIGTHFISLEMIEAARIETSLGNYESHRDAMDDMVEAFNRLDLDDEQMKLGPHREVCKGQQFLGNVASNIAASVLVGGVTGKA